MVNWMIKSAAGVALGATILCNVSPWFIPKAQQLSLAYIKHAQLQTLDKDKRIFNAEELWKKNGAVIYAAAEDLSSLKPELDARSVPLHAVVHQPIGVDQFQQYFQGDIFLDLQRKFYGPVERWASIPSLLSLQSLNAGYKAIMVRQVPGNFEGEGRLLGATFVIGPEDQGILYQHFETVAGDEAKVDDVRAAIEKIKLSLNP